MEETRNDGSKCESALLRDLHVGLIWKADMLVSFENRPETVLLTTTAVCLRGSQVEEDRMEVLHDASLSLP